MRKLEPMQLRSWAIPLVVAVLIAPPLAGFALAGPPVGLALGALAVGVLLAIAVQARYEEPIEVGSSPGDRYMLLVVALAAVEDPGVAERIAGIAQAGAQATVARGEHATEILVLAPALNTRVAEWLSDLGAARYNAQRRLALSLGTLSLGGLAPRGTVGDSDVVQAVEDTLRSFPAQEVVFVTHDDGDDAAIGDVRRRLDRPLSVIRAP